MLELWRAKLIAEGKVHLEDCESREAGKLWASRKLAELGHDGAVDWLDRDQSSVAVPAPGLEVHITVRS